MARTRGRRAGGLDTREAIIEEARRQFGGAGYAATTLRGVAAGADVDPRLVLHYFGSKKGLFEAALTLPVDPGVIVAAVLAGEGIAGGEDIGIRAAHQILRVLENPDARLAIIGNVRASVEDPEAASVVRNMLSERLLLPIARGIGVDHPELRAALMASQVIGLVIARYVVAFEPLASVGEEQLLRALAATLAGYLTGTWTQPGED